jgi:hypothetical protein
MCRICGRTWLKTLGSISPRSWGSTQFGAADPQRRLVGACNSLPISNGEQEAPDSLGSKRTESGDPRRYFSRSLCPLLGMVLFFRLGCWRTYLHLLGRVHLHLFVHLGIDNDAATDLHVGLCDHLFLLQVLRGLFKHYDDGLAIFVLDRDGIRADSGDRAHQVGAITVCVDERGK